jgi:hypothetical protein
MEAKFIAHFDRPMTDEELEQELIKFADNLLTHGFYLTAIIREADDAVGLVAPPEELEPFRALGAAPEPFDLESWIDNTKDKVFWMFDYWHGAPKLNRMQR